MKASLTSRFISVLTRVSPVADEDETVSVPILMPLYRTENRRLAAAFGKTNTVAAWEIGGKAQSMAPASADQDGSSPNRRPLVIRAQSIHSSRPRLLIRPEELSPRIRCRSAAGAGLG